MLKRAIGSVLMILGTSVGAGMLALPIVTAPQNLAISFLLLFFTWVFMTIGALCVLEVNLWLSANTNMISMAGKTLGPLGKLITWIVYLLLLYSLMCAYLSGLGDIIKGLFANINIILPSWLTVSLGLLIFGVIVYRGIGSVDIVNRGLMSVKFLAYFLLICLVAKHIHFDYVIQGNYFWNNNAFNLMLTSFGYAIIVPSLRAYLGNDVKLLKKVILIGSLIPFIIYALWIFVIQGMIPKDGDSGLITMIHASQPNSMMMSTISHIVNTTWIASVAKLFISICAVTSFLGVSICLVDFIADGFSINKTSKSGLLVYALTFLPPWIIVLVYPSIFIKALEYGGILCLILLIIIPLVMLYVGRYKKGLQGARFVPFGKVFLIGCFILSFAVLATNMM